MARGNTWQFLGLFVAYIGPRIYRPHWNAAHPAGCVPVGCPSAWYYHGKVASPSHLAIDFCIAQNS